MDVRADNPWSTSDTRGDDRIEDVAQVPDSPRESAALVSGHSGRGRSRLAPDIILHGGRSGDVLTAGGLSLNVVLYQTGAPCSDACTCTYMQVCLKLAASFPLASWCSGI